MHSASEPQKLAVRIAYDKAGEQEQAPENQAMGRGEVSKMLGYLKYHAEDGQAQVQVQLCLFIRILLLAFLLNIIKRIMIIIIIIVIVSIIIIITRK